MANEFGHSSVGTSMTQAEFEAVGLHVCNLQATGDLIYASSATQLSRLGIGSTGQVLTIAGGIPAWSNNFTATTLTITDGGTIGQSAGPLLTFDDTNNRLKLSGGSVVPATSEGVGLGTSSLYFAKSYFGGIDLGGLPLYTCRGIIGYLASYHYNATATDILYLGTDTLASVHNPITFGIAPVRIGAVTAHATTAGTNLLSIFNGTAPVGTLANGASFYCAAGEMQVIDSGGVVTLLSPHDPITGEWIFLSKNTVTGRVFRVEMERLMRKLEEIFGWGFVKEFIEGS